VQLTALAKALVEHLLHQRRHPQQGYRACLGILRLSKEVGDARLEGACERAIAIGAASYRSLKSILKNGLDKKRISTPAQTSLPLEHANVRGPDYYH
jgi:transposase